MDQSFQYGVPFDKREERRAKFAGMAMQGYLTNEEYIRACDYKDLARRSVRCADALLAALDKEEAE